MKIADAFVLVIVPPLLYIVVRNAITSWKDKEFIGIIWSHFTFLKLTEVMGLFLVIAFSTCLLKEIPIIKHGWTYFLFSQDANIVMAPVMLKESGSLLIRIVPLIFFVLLGVSMPFLVHQEELQFRYKTLEWSNICWNSIKFGLAHCIVGVSVAVGLSLSIAGFFLAIKYRQTFQRAQSLEMLEGEAHDAALIMCTAYHTYFNTLVLAIILVSLSILEFLRYFP